MASRLSFRPRPLDIHKKLAIVRDVTQLDQVDAGVARPVQHDHQQLDAENEQVLTVKKKTGGEEIPTPPVRNVATYEVDYRPNFVSPPSYIRARGSFWSPDYVEYDLDNEDDDWLAAYNNGQNRLVSDKFEAMLFKLELACHAAMDKSLTAAGATVTERMSASAGTTPAYLTREVAYEALKVVTQARPAVLSAVYDYWAAKRTRLKRPLLRRLQAPPSVSDTNPFNVFRPRDKINRPQTRRRRENDGKSYQAMAEIKHNLLRGKELLEWVQRRERRKRDLVLCEMDFQTLQIKLRHEPRQLHEQIEAEAAALLVARVKGRDRDLGGGGGKGGDARLKKLGKKRRRDGRAGRMAPPGPPQPPPAAPDVGMAFARAPEVGGAAQAQLPPEVDRSRCRARMGRGGRVIFDRCAPFTWEPLEPLLAVEEVAAPVAMDVV